MSALAVTMFSSTPPERLWFESEVIGTPESSLAPALLFVWSPQWISSGQPSRSCVGSQPGTSWTGTFTSRSVHFPSGDSDVYQTASRKHHTWWIQAESLQTWGSECVLHPISQFSFLPESLSKLNIWVPCCLYTKCLYGNSWISWKKRYITPFEEEFNKNKVQFKVHWL